MPSMSDQPPPIATERRPAWEIVIEHVVKHRDDSAYGSTGVVDRVIADMRDRDEVGRQRYGVRLTSGNGRDHLIDAWQEIADACVYLANELDERGVGPDTLLDESISADSAMRWQIFCVQQLFWSQVRSLIQLRALIEERAS
jgi:hypothetical protein